MGYTCFTELAAYKSCRLYKIKVSEIAKSHFPSDEKFKLTDQILRSSRGITAAIAEGFGRFHHQENIQYCRIARGSLFETLDHWITAFDEKYITEEFLKEMKEQYHDDCLKLLNGYIAYLKRAKDQ